MVLKIPYFIWKQETVWHEFIVYREESLQSADNDTENIFLSEVIHQWISVEDAFSHFYDIEVVIS